MVVVVLVLAIAILTTDFLSERLYGNKRTIFVVTMFAYAAYRSYRMYHFLKQERHNDDV